MTEKIKKKKSEITREKIFQAAIKLFQEKGYSETRTIDITKAIGVSHATFFVYFKTKELIIVELFNRTDVIYAHMLDESLSNDPIAQLRDFVSKIFNFIKENFNYEIASVMYSTETSYNNKNDYLISTDRATYKCFEKIVENGIHEGVFKKEISPYLVKILHTTFRGVLFDWILHEGKYDLLELSEKSLDCLLTGIK